VQADILHPLPQIEPALRLIPTPSLRRWPGDDICHPGLAVETQVSLLRRAVYGETNHGTLLYAASALR